MGLCTAIYELTENFPDREKFGLSAQLRRAAVSVPSNIAEGAARNSRADFANFIRIARGSLAEIETQLLIAQRLNYLGQDLPVSEKVECLFAKLNALLKSLQSSDVERH